MAGRLLCAALAVFLSWPVGPVAAQAIDTTGFVRGIYRDYLGRDPSPDESLAWVRALQRGTAASEVNAFILASDECYDRYRRDPNAWIAAAYNFVLNRQPTQRDLTAWGGRLAQLNNDRLRWSRDFLRAADWQAPSFQNPGTSVPPGDLPARLVTTCQLLTRSVQDELPGNRGWLAWTQANNLLTSAEANRIVLGAPANNPVAYSQAVGTLQTANDALRRTLAESGVTASTSRQYADQVYQILVVLRDQTPSAYPPQLPPYPPQQPQLPPYPQPPTIPPGGIDQPACDRCQRLVFDLRKAAQQFVGSLRNTYPRDWNTDRLLRDAEDFDAGIERFRLATRPGILVVDVRATLTQMRVQVERVSAQVRRGTFDRRVIQAWSDTAVAFNRLAESQGVPPGDLGDPWQPVPFNGPGGLPVNLGGQPTGGVAPLVVRALDDAIAQCDTLVVALTPYAFQSLVVPSVQNELRTLRNSLTELRKQANQGAGRAQLLAALDHCVEDMHRVETLWNRLVASPGVPRELPDLTAFKRAFQQVNDPTQYGN